MLSSKMTKTIRVALIWVTSNPVSAMGAIITIGGLLLLALFTLVYMASAEVMNPYYGALGFLGLPVLILAGAGMVVVGRLIFRDSPGQEPFWAQQFNIKDEKKALIIFGVSIGACVVFFGLSGAQTAKFMDSTNFCGQTCHSVMEPEAVSHANSTHSTIKCVRCHVGEGVQGLLISKIRGAWQVFSVLTNQYERPIPAPVKTLPSSEDTCKTCHDTGKDSPENMKLYTSFKDDEKSSRVMSAIVIDPGSSRPGAARGIHAHVSKGLKIRYYTLDKKRHFITWVESKSPQGTRVWSMEGETPPVIRAVRKTSKGRPIYTIEGKGEMREMDCVDCHNRAGHNFPDPEVLVDNMLAKGEIDPLLPYAKRVALKALMAAGEGPKLEAEGKIYSELAAAWPMDDSVTRISALLADAAGKYLYPRMNIGWGTYENLNRHSRDQGCFRCHNQRMKDKNGKNLSQDCDSCHDMVADKTPFEEWTKRLRPGLNETGNQSDKAKGSVSAGIYRKNSS
ncbi:hypothetical protein MNBD_NITROSPINAE03-157 [hydrothermal vent metagenome]|uniref:Cytochrome c domain-containing protein n=1 Tax=hydrothermal vent metagenome TaxID=652676 RepID=A0A3B1CCL7_9ZZZZ